MPSTLTLETQVSLSYQIDAAGAQRHALEDKFNEFLSAGDFLPSGYVTDGSVDYTTELQAAIDAAIASGRDLKIPAGTFKVAGLSAEVDLTKQLIIRGSGNPNTIIKNLTGTVLSISGQTLRFSDLALWSEGGGATVLQTGSVSQSVFERVSIIQLAADQSLWDNGGQEFIDNRFRDCFLQHTKLSSVYGFNLVAAGGIINDNQWVGCRIQYSGTKHFFNIENSTANAQYANKFEDLTFEVCIGGGIRLRGASGFLIKNCQNWDAGATDIVNDFYDIDVGNGIGCSGEIGDCGRWAGQMDTGKYDLSLPGGGGGAGIRVIDCRAAGGGDMFAANAKNNAIYVIGLLGSAMSITNGGGNVGVDMLTGTFNTQFGHYEVAGVQVVGAQGAAVADATDAASAITQLNTALARLRAHGLIAT